MTARRVTEPQRRYRAALAANLQKNTGRTLAEWVAIARTCPESAPRARLRWFKLTHGLGQNSAMQVFEALGGAQARRAHSPARLRAALWREPQALALLEQLERALARVPDLVHGQRKGYTQWSRTYAFAAARPVRGGVRVGLALAPDAHPRLTAARHEGWSERLKAVRVLPWGARIDAGLARLLQRAAAGS